MGQIDKERPKIPKFNREKRLIQAALLKTYKDLLFYLVETLHTAGINVSQHDIEAEVNRQMRALSKDVYRYTEHAIVEAFESGQAQQLFGVYSGMTEEEARHFVASSNPTNYYKGVPTPSYATKMPNTETIRAVAMDKALEAGLTMKQARKLITKQSISNPKVAALIRDTYGDILLATDNTKRSIKKVVRETVRDVLQYHSLTDQKYSVQAKEIKKRLTKKGLSEKIVKEGFVGITDKAGRKWDIGTYSDMVTKTKVNQAYIEGVRYEAEQTGIDLAVISSHGAKDACANWEGVVVSLNGLTPGYPVLDDVRATNEIFHPNCQHSVFAVRNIDGLHPDDVAKHKSKLADVGNYTERVYKRKN